jgi:hypothetical protein
VVLPVGVCMWRGSCWSHRHCIGFKIQARP